MPLRCWKNKKARRLSGHRAFDNLAGLQVGLRFLRAITFLSSNHLLQSFVQPFEGWLADHHHRQISGYHRLPLDLLVVEGTAVEVRRNYLPFLLGERLYVHIQFCRGMSVDPPPDGLPLIDCDLQRHITV